MTALIASIFSLCVGPLIYQTFGPLKRTDKIVSGIVLVIVVSVILFEVLPYTFEAIGIYAIIAALIGFAGPTLIEKTFHKAADTTHKLTIYLGIIGLLFHAFIDGAAIQANQFSDGNGLTLAIILHRLPVGLTIWWLLKPLLGEKYALITIGLMATTTYFGFIFSQSIGNYQNSYLFSFQAFIAGSLMHVVIHKPHSDGCMHTNETHHNHSKIANHKKPTHLVFKWEILGGIIGLLILLIMHVYM